MGLTPKKPPRQNGAFSKEEWNSWNPVQNRPVKREPTRPPTPAPAPRKWLLFLFVAGVGVGGFWLGRTRSTPAVTQQSSQTSTETVDLPNSGASLVKMNRIELRPEQPNRVSKEFQNSPASEEINIIGTGSGADQPMTVVLDEGNCKKTLWSVPNGARVLVNRTRFVGTTPLTLQGKCDLPVTLGFEVDEHETVMREVALEKDGGLGISVTLQRVKRAEKKSPPMAPSAVLQDVQKKLGEYMKGPAEIE